MATLRLEIDTDASYTSAELEELEETFLEFILPIDGDVRQGTENVRLIAEVSEDDEKDKVREAALNLIKSGALRVNIAIVEDIENPDEEMFGTGDIFMNLS